MGKLSATIVSRRAWLALASFIAILGQEKLGIPEDTLAELLAVAVAWIVGDSLRKT